MTTTTAADRLARLRALPKAEVHLRFEGCFEPALLEQGSRQQRVATPRPRERLLQFEGVADFLHFLDWACGLADTRERLAELAYDTSRRLAASGAGYADAVFNPTYCKAWHGHLPGALCQDAFGWSEDALRAVAATSIAASFATSEVEAGMREALAA